MTFDWDDAEPGNDPLPYLRRLKEIRSDFRCTLFAIPAGCTAAWCESVPEWVELAVHGWDHHSVYECAGWGRADMDRCLDYPLVADFFVEGFKAPGWQISDDCYAELVDRDWWVADQHLEDHRRPPMRVYFYEDGNWHGHVQNVCGNGLEETWGEVVERVRTAPEFRFASESARYFDPHADDSGTGAASS